LIPADICLLFVYNNLIGFVLLLEEQTMQWEQLTAPDFARAARETGVCIIAFGVLERHGDHLPLGTDFLNGHRLACLAADREAAVVFPPFYFGQIYEARCFPGTVALKPALLLEFVTNILYEVGRNGFRKIILLSAHGGNDAFLPFVTQSMLAEQKSYSVYCYDRNVHDEDRAAWNALLETREHGHACECETSISLANHPEIVRMDQISAPGLAKKRLEQLPDNFSAVSWYANYPEHYAGDARTASAEKGRALRDIQVSALARYIKAVKADKVVPALEREFFGRVEQVGKG
jgi:creatinine amidohydrolase